MPVVGGVVMVWGGAADVIVAMVVTLTGNPISPRPARQQQQQQRQQQSIVNTTPQILFSYPYYITTKSFIDLPRNLEIYNGGSKYNLKNMLNF